VPEQELVPEMPEVPDVDPAIAGGVAGQMRREMQRKRPREGDPEQGIGAEDRQMQAPARDPRGIPGQTLGAAGTGPALRQTRQGSSPISEVFPGRYLRMEPQSSTGERFASERRAGVVSGHGDRFAK